MKRFTTPVNVTHLHPNEVFVFGSNLAGRHGKGAALLAAQRFGAVRGQGEGEMGRSYAIPTKDKCLRTLPLADIAKSILTFSAHARAHPMLLFLVTEIGCGLAGYSPDEVAPLFVSANLPHNVALPASFLKIERAFESAPGVITETA